MTESTRDLSVDPCPLCGSRSSTIVASVPYASIWRELEGQLGLTVPDELRRRLTPARDAYLYACPSCGLEYFSPRNQGGSDFYGLLTSAPAGYYTDRRWEYSIAEKLLHDGDAVLDIGCGDGGFLRRVAPRVGRAVGVDENPAAIRRLADAGIEAHCADLEQFAAENAARFDVVCAFQLLEHLPSIAGFAQSVRSCATPGGFVLVSTPNNDRLRLNPLDPLDCPPHHVSRWRPDQLRRFARDFGFDPVDVVRERRRWRDVPGLLDRLRKRVRRSDEHSPAGDLPGSTPAGRRSLQLGQLRRLGLGHTMVLVARRPA
jgi:SAM-dependent methyltransferase